MTNMMLFYPIFLYRYMHNFFKICKLKIIFKLISIICTAKTHATPTNILYELFFYTKKCLKKNIIVEKHQCISLINNWYQIFFKKNIYYVNDPKLNPKSHVR